MAAGEKLPMHCLIGLHLWRFRSSVSILRHILFTWRPLTWLGVGELQVGAKKNQVAIPSAACLPLWLFNCNSQETYLQVPETQNCKKWGRCPCP